MNSWSTGSRGKTLVALDEDEFFLGNLDSGDNNIELNNGDNNSDGKFIKITQSCVINSQSQPNNITYLDTGVINSK